MSSKIEKWIEIKNRFQLSDKHIQMAKELNFNPAKFGKIKVLNQQACNAPLNDFIEIAYFKQFKRREPLNQV